MAESLRDALDRLEVEVDWDDVDMDSGKQTWHEQRGYLRRDSIADILRLVAEEVERMPLSLEQKHDLHAHYAKHHYEDREVWTLVNEVAKAQLTTILEQLGEGG